MADPFSGGCTCGAVRYQCSAEPLMISNCHCRNYQKLSGAPFASLVVLEDAVKFTGQISTHQVKADSGNTATRGFCPKCGSPLFGKPSGLPMKLIGLRAVTLDDPSWYKPTMSIYGECSTLGLYQSSSPQVSEDVTDVAVAVRPSRSAAQSMR